MSTAEGKPLILLIDTVSVELLIGDLHGVMDVVAIFRDFLLIYYFILIVMTHETFSLTADNELDHDATQNLRPRAPLPTTPPEQTTQPSLRYVPLALKEQEESMTLYNESIFIAPSSSTKIGDATRSLLRMDVRLQSTGNSLSPRRLSTGLKKLTIHVSDQACQSVTKSSLMTDSSTVCGPSGVSVSATFLKKDNETWTAAGTKQTFMKLLYEVLSQRLLLAPLSTVDRKRVMRHLQVNEEEGGLVQVTTILPLEGSPLSSESLRSFLSLLPCQERAGIFSVADSTTWSNLLLGASRQVKTALAKPKGFWIELSSDEATCNDNDCPMLLSQGLFYSINAMSQGPLSLRDVLPVSQKDPLLCPFAKSTMLDVAVGDVSSGVHIEVVATNDGPMTTTTDDDAIMSSELYGALSLSEPFATIRHAEGMPSSPLWHVDMDVLRRSGQANRGTIVSRIENNDPSCSARVSFVQSLPGVIEPLWQSFEVWSSVDGMIPWKSLDSHSLDVSETTGLVELRFQSSIPPSSSLELSLDYDPAFLLFETFPADPNRGFELPPFHVLFTSLCDSNTSQTLYSNTALLMAPVPDMSMPFNVLSLTCTMYAFVIGSIINLLVRRASEKVQYTLDPSKKPKGKLQALKERVVDKLSKLKRSRKGAEEKDAREDEKEDS